MTERDYAAECEAILDEAVAKVVQLASERFNDSCRCPEVHELGVASWVLAYEHVDMREGGSSMAIPEVIHSSNSYAQAQGLLYLGSGIVASAVLNGD